jgi:acetoin utilization deacetylase AcuC-like enzyme
MDLDLTEEDYLWVTNEIMNVANITCDGRVVSVLEGGYGQYVNNKPSDKFDRSSLGKNVAAHMRGLIGSIYLDGEGVEGNKEESKKRKVKYCICSDVKVYMLSCADQWV